MTKTRRIAAGLLATIALSAGLYSLRPPAAPPAPAAHLLGSGPGVAFDAFVTSDSLVIRPKDPATGNYLIVDSVASGNDVQLIGLQGPTAAGTFPLTFGGQTTSAVAFTATPPAVFATFQSVAVTPGTATELSASILPSPGFYIPDVLVEVIDGGTVTARVALDMADFTAGDFTLSNPSGGSTVQFKVLLPAYVPASSTISVRLSTSDASNFWDVDSLGVKVGTSARVVYDDGDSAHFASAGSTATVTPGGDARFWDGSYTRFHGGGGVAGMSYGIDPSAVQSALQALSSIGTGNVAVGSSGGQLRVEFAGTMGAVAQAQITSASPSVTFPSHVVGGSVPSITRTPSGGSPGSPASLRKTWIYQPGRTSGAIYQLAPDSITALATDGFSVTVPDGWAVTASGPLPGATVAASNRVGGSLLPAFDTSQQKTMGVGWNVQSEVYYAEGLQFIDMARRVTTFPLGSVAFGGNLALDANLYPTLISPNGSQAIVTEPPSFSLNNNPLGPLNAPNGLYTFYWDGPAGGIVPGGDFPTGTGVTAVDGFPDVLTGTTGNRLVRNVQADPSKSRAPKLIFNWGASGPETTFNGQPALPCATKNLRIYPPDPSDPTGMTPWLNPTGKFHPAFLRMLAGAKSIRVDQAMNPVLANSYADLADIRAEAQLGRGDFTRQPLIPVASCRQYTGTPAANAPMFLSILVTTAVPHTLSSGMRVDFAQCGTMNLSNGSSFPIGAGGLSFGVITVLDATSFVWHAGQPPGGGTGVTMTNVTTGGSVTSSVGTGWAVSDCIDACNAVGADLWFDTSVNISDACIDQVADLIAARLNPGLKVRPELGDETWNFSFETFAWLQVRNWQLYGIENSSLESTVHDQNNLSKRFEARFAAAGRGQDVVYVMPSQDSSTGRTAGMLAFAAAQSPPYRVDEVAVAPYFQSMDANGTIDIPTASALPLGVNQDILDLWIDSDTSGLVSPHVAVITASAYPSARLVCYESGGESMPACMTIGNALGYPGAYQAQHSMHRSWREHRLFLRYLEHLQGDGASLINKYYLFAGGALQVYATTEWYDQPDGTGTPSEDGSDYELLAPGGPPSQEAGAIRLWNSLLSTSPALSVSPATATVRDGSGTVAIRATLANSTASLTASLAGSGSISTANPSSGVPFTYTPPGSGSGTATITVLDATDGLSKTCVITYSPAGVTPKTPVRIDRIRPFRRVHPKAASSRDAGRDADREREWLQVPGPRNHSTARPDVRQGRAVFSTSRAGPRTPTP